MPNDTGLTEWVIVTNQRTGRRFPALMYPEENELIRAEWAQVPEDVLAQWASESVPEALHTISERSLQAGDFRTAFEMLSRGAE
jgi:hypothetical protein